MGNSIGSTRGEDPFALLPQIDTCILGRRMYPGYEQYWAATLANPEGVLPFTGRVATKGEIAYARFAERTPHVVLSRTLDTVAWTNTRIVRGVEDIRRLKQQPGKDMHAVGGAMFDGIARQAFHETFPVEPDSTIRPPVSDL
jgi:dihydrofolate reductase